MIEMILSQMNNNRLSTNLNKLNVDRTLLESRIDKLLRGPSNLELKEDGRIFIKSLNKYYSDRSNLKVKLQYENGLVLNSFDSMASCAKFLGIYPAKAKKRLEESKPVLFNNTLLYIKYSNSED